MLRIYVSVMILFCTRSRRYSIDVPCGTAVSGGSNGVGIVGVMGTAVVLMFAGLNDESKFCADDLRRIAGRSDIAGE